MPSSTSFWSVTGTSFRNFVPSFVRSLTSRSASISGVARTPQSAPAVRGSLRIRKIRPHSRAESRSCLRIVSSNSRNNTPCCTMPACNCSNMKSAGTTVPSGASASPRSASCMICSWARSIALVPAGSTARNTCSQNRRRTGRIG